MQLHLSDQAHAALAAASPETAEQARRWLAQHAQGAELGRVERYVFEAEGQAVTAACVRLRTRLVVGRLELHPRVAA